MKNKPIIFGVGILIVFLVILNSVMLFNQSSDVISSGVVDFNVVSNAVSDDIVDGVSGRDDSVFVDTTLSSSVVSKSEHKSSLSSNSGSSGGSSGSSSNSFINPNVISTKGTSEHFDMLENPELNLLAFKNDDLSRIIISFSGLSKSKVSGKDEFVNFLKQNNFDVVHVNSVSDSVVVLGKKSSLENLLKNSVYKDASLTADIPLRPAMDSETDALIKYNQLKDYFNANGLNYTGKGQSICIIDTGISFTHEAFGSCPAYNVPCPKIPWGWDYYNSHPNFADPNGHGTSLSGIVAGNSSSYKGMLPDAKIIALKITDSSGNGWSSLIDDAVYGCMANASKFNSTTILVGLASASTFVPSDCVGASGYNALRVAYNAGFNVIAPSGNGGVTNAMSYPAVCENVTSVAGVKDYGSGYDTLWTGSNRHPQYLDLLTVADRIRTTGLNDQYGDVIGTSVAAAAAAAGFMLMEEVGKQMYGVDYSPKQIENILKITGKQIYDGGSGASYPRLNLERALHFETVAPSVVLLTPNNSLFGASFSLNYSVFDVHHGIKNCSLFINGNFHSVDYSVVENSNEFFSVNLANGNYSWKVVCYDNSTFPNMNETSLRYFNVDSRPYISNLPDVNVSEDMTPPNNWVDLWGFASDRDNVSSELNFTITQQSNVSLISCRIDSSRYFNCAQPAHDLFGVSVITVQVSDGHDTDSDSFSVNVTAVNDAPVIGGLPGLSVSEDSGLNNDLIFLESFAIDVESPSNSLFYSIVQQSNTSVINCVVDGGNYVDCTTQTDMFGFSVVTVQVSDGLLTDSDVFRINVTAVNDAPVISGLLDLNVSEDTAPPSDWVDLWGFASDVDDVVSSLSFSITQQSNSTLISCRIDNNRYFNCAQPAHDWFGFSVITIQVSDSGFLFDTDSFRVNVTPVNDAPVIGGLPNQNMNEDSGLNNNLIFLPSFASDVQTPSNSLIYTIVSQTQANIVDCVVDNQNYVDCTTQTDMFGNSIVTVQVSDGFLTDSDSFTVTVNAVNDAPILSGIPDLFVDEDVSPPSDWVDLWGFASDVDNLITDLSFSIFGQSNNGLIDCRIDSNRYFNCNTPANNQFGVSDVTVQVSDGFLFDTDTFRITVNSVNDAPVITNLPYKVQVSQGSNIQYTIRADDVESDPLTFNFASRYNGPSLNQQSGLFDWTPVVVGLYDFTIIASDGNGGSDSEILSVNVTSIPLPDLVINSLVIQSGAGSRRQLFGFLTQNIGAANVGSFRFCINTNGLGGDVCDTVTPSGNGGILRPGEGQFWYKWVNFVSAGSRNAVLTVDPNNSILEENELNNNKSVMVTVN